MLRTMFYSKIHRATVTHADKEYEGSCAIDSNLLKAANIYPHQQIDIYNVTNGERFTTYAIPAEPGSGIISVNGAAAWKATPGDIIIIVTYIQADELEQSILKPKIIHVNANNQIIGIIIKDRVG